MTIYLMILIN